MKSFTTILICAALVACSVSASSRPFQPNQGQGQPQGQGQGQPQGQGQGQPQGQPRTPPKKEISPAILALQQKNNFVFQQPGQPVPRRTPPPQQQQQQQPMPVTTPKPLVNIPLGPDGIPLPPKQLPPPPMLTPVGKPMNGDLLAGIRGGAKLRKVDQPPSDAPKLTPSDAPVQVHAVSGNPGKSGGVGHDQHKKDHLKMVAGFADLVVAETEQLRQKKDKQYQDGLTISMAIQQRKEEERNAQKQQPAFAFALKKTAQRDVSQQQQDTVKAPVIMSSTKKYTPGQSRPQPVPSLVPSSSSSSSSSQQDPRPVLKSTQPTSSFVPSSSQQGPRPILKSTQPFSQGQQQQQKKTSNERKVTFEPSQPSLAPSWQAPTTFTQSPLVVSPPQQPTISSKPVLSSTSQTRQQPTIPSSKPPQFTPSQQQRQPEKKEMKQTVNTHVTATTQQHRPLPAPVQPVVNSNPLTPSFPQTSTSFGPSQISSSVPHQPQPMPTKPVFETPRGVIAQSHDIRQNALDQFHQASTQPSPRPSPSGFNPQSSSSTSSQSQAPFGQPMPRNTNPSFPSQFPPHARPSAMPATSFAPHQEDLSQWGLSPQEMEEQRRAMEAYDRKARQQQEEEDYKLAVQLAQQEGQQDAQPRSNPSQQPRPFGQNGF